MPPVTPMYSYDETIKLIKWARKRGALLIKVNGVELTFPPDIDFRGQLNSETEETPRTIAQENMIAEKSLRKALSTDALNQIEDQEKWFHNNRPPIIG